MSNFFIGFALIWGMFLLYYMVYGKRMYTRVQSMYTLMYFVCFELGLITAVNTNNKLWLLMFVPAFYCLYKSCAITAADFPEDSGI